MSAYCHLTLRMWRSRGLPSCRRLTRIALGFTYVYANMRSEVNAPTRGLTNSFDCGHLNTAGVAYLVA
jgi:hypothetical protein